MRHFCFDAVEKQTLLIKFECDKCGKEINSAIMRIPNPDYIENSKTDEEVCSMCFGCGKQFDITIYSTTYSKGVGSINRLPESYPITVVTN